MTGISSMQATAHVRKHSAMKREKDDFYRTPPAATRALLAVETFPPHVWEPCCGDGAISRVLVEAGHRVTSSDLIARGYGAGGQDFLFERERVASAVLTNPPFKLADEFALHALHLGCTKVALFARLAWLEGDARRKRLWGPHPPSRIWAFSKRQTLWRGDDESPQTSGGAIAFAWFVWERGQVGPVLGWLP